MCCYIFHVDHGRLFFMQCIVCDVDCLDLYGGVE